MRPPVFSPAELLELMAADAEIEETFYYTREELASAKERDREASPENKRAAWKRAYYQKHKAEDNAKSRAWRAAHRDWVKAYNKEYRAKHQEELRERRRLYYAAHRDEINARRRKRCREKN